MKLTSKNETKEILDIVSDSIQKLIQYQILNQEQTDKKFKEILDKIDKQNILSSVKQTTKEKSITKTTKKKSVKKVVKKVVKKIDTKSKSINGFIFLRKTSKDNMITGIDQHEICNWSSVKKVSENGLTRLEGSDEITFREGYEALEELVKPSAYINNFGQICKTIFVIDEKTTSEKVCDILERNKPLLTVVKEPKTKEQIEAYRKEDKS
tara:strand:+ start:156 stop:785 length:630 start_codon:yes stop_codon:yes gene_type:complete